jgi:hypothetical protein
LAKANKVRRSVVGLVVLGTTVGFIEGVVEVPHDGWGLYDGGACRDDLGGSLCDLLPLLLALGQTKGAIRVLVDVALIEHQVNLLLHTAELMNLLLHLLELPQLLGDVSLLLLLLELLLFDLGSGLATLGGSLHEVARFALRD